MNKNWTSPNGLTYVDVSQEYTYFKQGFSMCPGQSTQSVGQCRRIVCYTLGYVLWNITQLTLFSISVIYNMLKCLSPVCKMQKKSATRQNVITVTFLVVQLCKMFQIFLLYVLFRERNREEKRTRTSHPLHTSCFRSELCRTCVGVNAITPTIPLTFSM